MQFRNNTSFFFFSTQTVHLDQMRMTWRKRMMEEAPALTLLHCLSPKPMLSTCGTRMTQCSRCLRRTALRQVPQCCLLSHTSHPSSLIEDTRRSPPLSVAPTVMSSPTALSLPALFHKIYKRPWTISTPTPLTTSVLQGSVQLQKLSDSHAGLEVDG